jgi:hypothetical protein
VGIRVVRSRQVDDQMRFMTMFDRAIGIDGSYNWFRLTALLFATLLGAQCVWLLLAELARPSINQLPTDVASAAAAAKQRDAAYRAASIGGIRSDLWAEVAFTYADLLEREKNEAIANANPASTLLHARATLTRALDDGPHQSSVWLLLAGLNVRFPYPGFDALELLKMSYYTGPNEQALVPLRLRIAVQLDASKDIEMRQFISRDVRMLLAQNRKSTISEAYKVASTASKRFIESIIRDIDPPALDSLQNPPG